MKILIAVEDKLFGEAIADFVCRHVWGKDDQFRLIHVVEPIFTTPLYGYPSELGQSLLEEGRRAGKSLVMALGTTIIKSFPGVSVKDEVLEGTPKETIIEVAKEWQADLIILGSHGKTGIGKFLLGSVSMSVLSAAPCTVMIVKLPKHVKKSVDLKKEASVK